MKFTLGYVAALTALCANFQLAESERLSMTLEQKKGRVLNTPAQLNRALAKYGVDQSKGRINVGSAAAIIELDSAYVDVEYVGKVGFGTPPQTFNMDFDTGSADIWIPSVKCAKCNHHSRFDPAKSSTFKGGGNETWSLRYGDGSAVTGVIGHDTVHLGDVTHPGQLVGLTTAESNDFLRDQYMDGIFGLGFPSLSYTGQRESIVVAMHQSGTINQPLVGVWLGRARDGGHGEIIFGDVNPNHFEGEIKWISLISRKYWEVKMEGIEINGETITNTSQAAIVDTGTTLIILPPALAKAIHDAIPGAKFSSLYGWQIPCTVKDSDATISFKLGGYDFPISVTNLIRERSPPQDGMNLCYSGIAEAPIPLIIMGDTFLRSYYSVYDFEQGRVGLAPAKK
ncbi:aspartic peptidase domain-containing protein [Radiomyces spectabilis]|uniref:aspartic peptidase domain-containing protein n=1 Tax=Radiomyces spectabilis TaxID=64574 RepID=UPI00222104C8|nr:aspartic peptidase domain-containing protein [Radiomyces spectabilis]KAI8391419.1 aspartic peptidase domain-containing protein [Radiomyces spectabilis]